MKTIKNAIYTITYVLILSFPLKTYAITDIDLLANKAKNTALYLDKEWVLLMHYKETFTGYESEIDDPSFFISENGKTDSAAEMKATIRLLFGKENPEKASRFTARYDYLKKKLDVPKDLYNNALESETSKILEENPADHATVLFAYEYSGAIESWFGHIFLAVHMKDSEKHPKTLNYSAQIRDEPILLVPFRGIFGYYKGTFSFGDYKSKVNSYGDAKRGVWEYRMSLTSEEIRKLLLHLHELDKVYCDFYFLDENCSQKLLGLVNTARPNEDLSISNIYISPMDTLIVLKKNGFISGEGELILNTGIQDMTPPDKRHGSRKISVSGGTSTDGMFGEVSFRPLYYSINDSNPGVKPGQYIEVFDMSARYVQKNLSLEKFTVFDVLMMNGFNEGFGNAVRAKTGFRRFLIDDTRRLDYGTCAGYGLSYNSFFGLMYLLASADINIYNNKNIKFSSGPGASGGMAGNITSRWHYGISTEFYYYPIINRTYEFRVSFLNTVNFFDNICAFINLAGAKSTGSFYWETSLGISYFCF